MTDDTTPTCFLSLKHAKSGIKVLDEVQATLAREGQALYVSNVKSVVRDKLAGTPIWERLGGELLYLSLSAMLDHLVGRGKWGGEEEAGKARPTGVPEQHDDYRYNDNVI